MLLNISLLFIYVGTRKVILGIYSILEETSGRTVFIV